MNYKYEYIFFKEIYERLNLRELEDRINAYFA